MLEQQSENSLLQGIAARVCWWQPPGETLEDIPLFLCRVMTFGTWEDASFCLDHFGWEAFRGALGATKALPPEFNPLISLKALTYFGEASLAGVPASIREALERESAKVDNVQPVEKLASTISAS